MIICYVDKFYIKPGYRGKGIGHIVFPMILDVIGKNAGAIVIIPSPTEDNGNKRIEKNDKRYKAILKQMTKFIENFGFVRHLERENVWIKNNQEI